VVTNLAEVEDLPRYLAVFLILLSLVTLAHALAVTRHLRRRELGTLRALGLTGRGAAAVVDVQALTILTVALAAAVPVGLALGTQVWVAIAERAHVVVLSVWPWAGIAVLVVAGAVGSVALSAPSARRALRLPPASALRAE